jgi:glycosyltransferase involved in cell wall biosynthesis
VRIGLSALKTYEYMACGKPVIVSDIPGQIEFVSSSEGGITFAAEDSNELAEKIIYLLANPFLRTEMGQKGRSYIVANNSWNSVSRKVIKVCEKVVKSKQINHL